MTFWIKTNQFGWIDCPVIGNVEFLVLLANFISAPFFIERN